MKRLLVVFALVGVVGTAAAFRGGALPGPRVGGGGVFYPTYPTAYRVLGDSIAKGTTGPTAVANSWAVLVSDATRLLLTNSAVDGDQAIDTSMVATAINVYARDVTIIQVGTNDQRLYTTDADKLAVYRSALQAVVAGMAIPEIEKVRGINTAIPRRFPVLSGTMVDTPVAGGGKKLTANGATVTATINGTAIWVAMVTQKIVGTASYSVSVDGVSKGTFHTESENAPNFTTQNGLTYGERLHRFAGLSAGDHTVVVTAVTADATHPVYFQWASGNGWINFNARPRVVLTNVLPQWSTGYTCGGSQANTLTYNTAIASDVADLVSDGLDVKLVDGYSAINPATDTIDCVHLNDAANVKMKTLFYTSGLGG